MPRVGSSRMSTFGLAASQRASTTFCWLPPDSLPTSWSSDGVLTAAARRTRRRSVRSSRRWTKRNLVNRRRITMDGVLEDAMRMRMRPSRLRSSGANPMPGRIASAGLRIVDLLAVDLRPPRRSAAGRRRSPWRARCARRPTSPAKPTTSPARISKSMPRCQIARQMPLTAEHHAVRGSAGCARRRRSARGRPSAGRSRFSAQLGRPARTAMSLPVAHHRDAVGRRRISLMRWLT